ASGPPRSAPGWLEKPNVSKPWPNMGWLKALTNCASKRTDTRSVIRVVFATAKSTFHRKGPRRAPKPRRPSANVGYRKLAATSSGLANIFGTPPGVLRTPNPFGPIVGLLTRVITITSGLMGINPWDAPVLAVSPNSVPQAELS